MNNSDDTGYWKLPNWAKIVIGAVAVTAAVVLTGGAAAPILASVAVSTLSGAIIGGLTNGTQGIIDGACDGFMWGGILAFGSAAGEAVKIARTTKNTVYISKSATGTVQYVGITNDFARRAAEHLATKGIRIQKLISGLSRSDARAVEQCLIEYYGLMKNGGTLLNRINSIAKSNKIYANSLKKGWDILMKSGVKL